MDRLSLLDAVNMVIRVAGEQPVQTLVTGVNDTLVAQAIIAEHTLRWLTANHIMSNTFTDTWTPDSDGHIALPANTLFVTATDRTINITQRDSDPVRLWNIDENTYVFDEALELQIVVGTPFDELPVPSQLAIVDSSRREYQMIMQGDTYMDTVLREDSVMSKAQARAKDTTAKRSTLFNNPYNLAYKFNTLRYYNRTPPV
jgi:hypothetical protein